MAKGKKNKKGLGSLGNTLGNVTEQVGEVAEGATGQVGEVAGGATEQVGQVTGQVGEVAGGAACQLRLGARCNGSREARSGLLCQSILRVVSTF